MEFVPSSLAIIGGDAVAVELAAAHAALGTQVTLIARGGLLEGTEPFAGGPVADALRARGVDVLLHTEPVRVLEGEHGVTVETSTGDAVGAAELLVTTRHPITTLIDHDSTRHHTHY